MERLRFLYATDMWYYMACIDSRLAKRWHAIKNLLKDWLDPSFHSDRIIYKFFQKPKTFIVQYTLNRKHHRPDYWYESSLVYMWQNNFHVYRESPSRLLTQQWKTQNLKTGQNCWARLDILLWEGRMCEKFPPCIKQYFLCMYTTEEQQIPCDFCLFPKQ